MIALVIEADESVRDMLSSFLFIHGYGVVAVADGAQALKQFSKFVGASLDIDLLWTELMTPGFRADELLTIMKMMKPGTDFRTIVCNFPDDESVNLGELGFEHIITKPFSYEEFMRIVGNTSGLN